MQLERGMSMQQPIYLALDFPTWEQADHFLETNKLAGVPVKVGMELFYREGPVVIEHLKKRNHPIFLDLKLHDIPTTIYKAMRNLANLGVDMVNIHGLGGSAMIKAAKQGLIDGSNQMQTPKLLVVTMLTSMDQETVEQELAIQQPIETIVTNLALLGKGNGADGVVCSAHEAKAIKRACGDDFLAVTPGIRLTNTANDDQKRVATPVFAKEQGADALVIGRSITASENPTETYQQAVKEWNHVSS